MQMECQSSHSFQSYVQCRAGIPTSDAAESRLPASECECLHRDICGVLQVERDRRPFAHRANLVLSAHVADLLCRATATDGPSEGQTAAVSVLLPQNGLDAELQPVLDWLEDNYVGRLNRNGRRRTPIFPVRMLNV